MNNTAGGLIPLEKDLLTRYQKTYLRREKLIQECNQLEGLYMRLFGELITRCFEAQISCISRKKEITLYQASYNRGEVPDPEKIAHQLEAVMSGYHAYLEELKQDSENARNARRLTEEERLKIRKIHRDLVFRLHPDLHPEYAHDEQMAALWQTMTTAYECMDLAALEQVALQVASLLDGNAQASIDLSGVDFEKKIEELEAQMEEICANEPYLYRNWIYDPELVQEKTDELNEQLQQLQGYARELDEWLAELITRMEERTCQN